MVMVTSLCSSSLFHPKSNKSSAKSRWLILCDIIGIRMPQSSTSFSLLDSISGMTLKHMGEEIPPCLTPFCIVNVRDSLLLMRSLLVPSCCSSASIATVSGFHPVLTSVSYSCGRLTESNAFFRSINQQYSLPPSRC